MEEHPTEAPSSPFTLLIIYSQMIKIIKNQAWYLSSWRSMLALWGMVFGVSIIAVVYWLMSERPMAAVTPFITLILAIYGAIFCLRTQDQALNSLNQINHTFDTVIKDAQPPAPVANRGEPVNPTANGAD